MAKFKFLKGNSSRIDTKTTPFNEGYSYLTTDDGGLYFDVKENNSDLRVRVTSPVGSHTHKKADITDFPDSFLVDGKQTTTSNADGGDNVYTFTKSDGSTSKLTVKNGSKGSKGDAGTNGKDGANGERGTGILKITTAPSSYTTATNGVVPTYRIALSTVLSQSGVDKVLIGDVLEYSYYHYPVILVDSSYVYCGVRTSIRGATGAAGADGAAAGFGTPTASIDNNTGTPSVSVTASGSDTEKVFAFVFKNLKGAKGDKGDTGADGAKGDKGDAGADGLTTKVTLGGTTFTHSSGTVTVTDAAVQKAVTPTVPTSGQVAVYDGTSGKLKSSGYTIEKSVPSDAEFTDTTYSVMGKATASAGGASGLVPESSAGDQAKFLKADATWAVPTNTNYYPTKFAWTDGTTAGPTGSLTGSGMSAVSFDAIPSAGTGKSGIVTTGDQSFAGSKTFNDGIYIGKSDGKTPGKINLFDTGGTGSISAIQPNSNLSKIATKVYELPEEAGTLISSAGGTFTGNVTIDGANLYVNNGSNTGTIGNGTSSGDTGTYISYQSGKVHALSSGAKMGYGSIGLTVTSGQQPVLAMTSALGTGTGTALMFTSGYAIVKSSSSRRSKTNINYDIDKEKYHNALMNMKSVEFEYKNGFGTKELGMIAEEVEEASPIAAIYEYYPVYDEFEEQIGEEPTGRVDNYKDRAIIQMLVMEAQRKESECQQLRNELDELRTMVKELSDRS